jgi:cytochrome c2
VQIERQGNTGYDYPQLCADAAGTRKRTDRMTFRTFTMALALIAVPMAALADGDAEKGEKVFRKCKACHVVDSDANRVGPSLQNIVGRTAGTVEGFKYSPAMKAAGEGGLTWTEENIDKYMADPKGFVEKNKMAFVGLKKEDERADVIAYLKTFSAQ